MVSLTGEYALRAMVFLAKHVDECPVTGRAIADETGIPRKYLMSLLSLLVRSGLLESSPGLGGGFSLARPAKQITLMEVLVPFEPTLSARRACPFGKGECNPDDPCPAHNRWERVREAFSRFLERTSVHSAAFKARERGDKASGRRAKQ